MKSIYEKEFPEMFRFIREDKLEIYYDPPRRVFEVGGKTRGMRQQIAYCPWAGSRLPQSLSQIFSEMLASRDLSGLERETWPEDWRTEEWWIEKGL